MKGKEMRLICKSEVVEELIEKGIIPNNKYGFGKKTQNIVVNGRYGTYIRRQEVGRKQQFQDKQRKRTQDENESKGRELASIQSDVVGVVGGNYVVGRVTGYTNNTVDFKTVKGAAYKLPFSKIITGDKAGEIIKTENEKLNFLNEADYWKSLTKFRGEKPDGSKEDGMQPTKDFTELYKLCNKDHSHLVKICNDMGKVFNLPQNQICMRKELKGLERAKDKLREDYFDAKENGKFANQYNPETDKYNCESLRDIDGGTIVFNSMAELDRALELFTKDPRIIREKNNFVVPNPRGYSDINMNVRLPNGTVSEIQMNTVANIVAKETYGHSIYEISRNPKMKEHAGSLCKKLDAIQDELYSKAREFSMKQNFPSLNGENPFNGVQNDDYKNIVKAGITPLVDEIQKSRDEGLIDDKTWEHYTKLLKII